MVTAESLFFVVHALALLFSRSLFITMIYELQA
jgi:hypothetical protein